MLAHFESKTMLNMHLHGHIDDIVLEDCMPQADIQHSPQLMIRREDIEIQHFSCIAV